VKRKFRVVRKFKEETDKGWKFGIRLANIEGDSFKIMLDSESELSDYHIQDELLVEIVNPQTKWR